MTPILFLSCTKYLQQNRILCFNKVSTRLGSGSHSSSRLSFSSSTKVFLNSYPHVCQQQQQSPLRNTTIITNHFTNTRNARWFSHAAMSSPNNVGQEPEISRIKKAIRWLSKIMTKGRESERDAPSKSELLRLATVAKPEIGLLVVALLALGVSSGVTLYFPAAFGEIVDIAVKSLQNSTPTDVIDTTTMTSSSLSSSSASVSMTTVVMNLFGLFLLASSAIFVRSAVLTRVGERIAARLREKLFHKLLQQEISFFETQRSGELVSRLSSDTTVMAKALSDHVSSFTRSSIECIGGCTMLFAINPHLAGATLAVLPLISISSAIYGRYVKSLSHNVQDALAKATGQAAEALASVRDIRLLSGEEREVHKYRSSVRQVQQLGTQVGVATAAFSAFAALMTNTSLLAVLCYGSVLVSRGDITVGALTSFLVYSLYVAGAIINLSQLYGELMRAVGAAQRIFSLLDRQSLIPDQSPRYLPPTAFPSRLSGDIRFENLHFHYNSRPHVQVLNDFNLSIRSNEIVAFVGESGAGKSTIISLLTRLHDPVQGHIWLDSVESALLPPPWIRKHIRVVPQEPLLFAGTVVENITYAKPEASQLEIDHAIRVAHCAHFLSEFPEGLNTYVGERGVTLSAGQKQRIAIARTVLLDPDVVVLDEATSALDAESEESIAAALGELAQNRTLIIIAHRMATVRRATRIVVVGDGKVLEDGSWDELAFRPNGTFANMLRAAERADTIIKKTIHA